MSDIIDQELQVNWSSETQQHQKGRWNTTVFLLRVVFVLVVIYLWKLYQGE